MEICYEKEYLSELYFTADTTDKKHRFQPDIVKRHIMTVYITESVQDLEDLYCFRQYYNSPTKHLLICFIIS